MGFAGSVSRSSAAMAVLGDWGKLGVNGPTTGNVVGEYSYLWLGQAGFHDQAPGPRLPNVLCYSSFRTGG